MYPLRSTGFERRSELREQSNTDYTIERWLQPASPSSVSERTWIPENHGMMSVIREFFTAEDQREDEVTEGEKGMSFWIVMPNAITLAD